MVAVTKNLIDISLADTVTGWAGTSGQLDTEVFKQGIGAYTYQTGKSGIETATFTPAANINMTANYTTPHMYWTMRCDVFPFCELLNTGATNSGLMIRVTDGAGNYVQWHLAGKDTWDGSWRTFVLDLTNTANIHSTVGTLSLADVDIISFITDNSNSGNIRIIDNTWVDSVRYGDGLQIQSTTTEAFDFTDVAADDALTANYYGVQQPFFGILATQGGLIVGDGTTTGTANLVSRNEQLVFQDQIVSAAHYGLIAVASATATTDIDITGMVLSTVGLTGADVDFTDPDLNSVIFTDSTFINMGTTKMATGYDFRRNVYAGCGQITPDGADIRNSTISGYEGTVDTGVIVYNNAADPDGEFDGMSITKGIAATHAIEFGLTSPLSITLRDMIFSGYNAANTNTDSTFYVARTTGTVTINIIGGSGNVTYKSAGAIVVIVQNPVTALITVIDIDTTLPIENARVIIEAADGTGDLGFEDSITITRVTTVATVAHTAHPYIVGNKVNISGAVESEYNGVKTITAVATNSYDFTVAGTPATPATGTITSTGLVLEGLTDIDGKISDTRSYSLDQPIVGWARKSTGSPYYRTGPFTGIVTTAGGYSQVQPLILDE